MLGSGAIRSCWWNVIIIFIYQDGCIILNHHDISQLSHGVEHDLEAPRKVKLGPDKACLSEVDDPRSFFRGTNPPSAA
tara:strand:- start:924 stop:1157 length:234 start_codon:yes stop_codon:yes gene_type:complete